MATPGPFIMPSTAHVAPSGSVALTASNGTGTGFVWSFITNQSGGTINSGTGAYTAGSLVGVDTVQVADSAGNAISVPITVQSGPTLAALTLQAQQRGDFVNSNFVTSAEWTSYINGSAFRLFNIIIQHFGDDYVSSLPYRWLTDGVTERYQLPPDIFKLLGVDLLLNANQPSYRLTIYPFNRGQRNKYSPWNIPISYGMLSNLHYHLDGNYMWFTPFPSAGQYIQIQYIPTMTALVNSTDVLNTGVLAGFEEFVVIDAAIKARVKEESDVGELMRDRAEILQSIEEAAENRDAGMPATVTDSNWSDMWWPGGTSGWGSSGG
ncbi:MAG TPA: hypothetical protein VMT56_00325 [Candidatus Bathyarchaeia archaeon]|nr:hypothetical protein [Candidatus Bathyarchaeia archaeon]